MPGDRRERQVSWHCQETGAVARALDTDQQQGLSEDESRRRLAQSGPNELVERGTRRWWAILLDQLRSLMVLILVGAAGVSFLLREQSDAVAIIAIVALNVLLGFVQELRAARAMHALKRLAVPRVRARRENRVREFSARELVPGDVVLLEPGTSVPADGRLVEAVNLRIQESTLTGESEPVDKTAEVLSNEDLALGDRRNMAFLGTAVSAGRGSMIVTSTGMRTELGRIAGMLQSVRAEPSPLARRMGQLARGLALAVAGVVALVFAVGLLRGEEVRVLLLTAISMGVAAIPEGLPAVVTIALALGARRMLGRRALIRRLEAVETLGSVTVICTDKTGTLTENRMTVTLLDVAGHRVELPVIHDGWPDIYGRPAAPALSLLLAGGALCNDALLEPGGERPKAVGDPTEGALVLAAHEQGLSKLELDEALPRLAEVGFSSARKRMTTVHRAGQLPETTTARVLARALRDAGLDTGRFAFTKGAVDVMTGLAVSVWNDDHAEPLHAGWRDRIRRSTDVLAGRGMRVLGVGFRKLTDEVGPVDESVEQGLVLVGLVAMVDPARAEVPEAVATCRRAGIRPVMVTGDHPLTARYIAGQVGIGGDAEPVTGNELAGLGREGLHDKLSGTNVFARVAPEHKLDIVGVLQQGGEVVAMTGDGVNDAPALQQADIGVAMGVTGTDVAKDAADMVLLDDNFATIVAAVREGRAIYDNIRKFIRYTLTSNAGEIWVMLLAPLLGMPLPLLPLQILWVNLVTDGLPGLAFGVEPAERDTMERPPYRLSEGIFGRGLAIDVLWIGLLMGVVSLGHGFVAFRLGVPRAEWTTMVFTTLTLIQLGNALAIRSSRDSLFQIGLFSNRPMVGAVAFTFALQLAVVYWPPLQRVFHTAPLSAAELAVSLGLSTAAFWAVELAKLVRRRRGRAEGRA